MWGRHGLKDCIVDVDGMCYFKFKHEEGMNYVIDQSPWVVNVKPLLVQKGEPETVIIKESPCKILIWIRLLNIPLEAWSVRGISALASRLGMPIKMDQVTADMYRDGTGRLGYARFLVEINAANSFFDKIEINYVDEMKKLKSTKWVIVKYTWKPDRCGHCDVFGHSVQRCDAKPKHKPVVNNNIRTSDGIPRSADQEGFVKVRHRKNQNIIKQGWNRFNDGSKKQQTAELRNSANKYAILSEEEDHIKVDPFIDKRLLVDEFIKKKLQPNCEETKNWTYNMITYFKYQWEAMERKEKEGSDEEYVFKNEDQATQSFMAYEILGNGCGWNSEEVDVMVVQSCSQTILCLVEIIHTKVKLFVSFVYASNSGVERRELWNELSMHKSIVNNKAWVIMGDFNVTLKHEEHSNGASSMSTDMNEFKNAVNKIKVEDLRCTGFQFTWTKSLKNPMCNTLKKLVRIMINDSFIQMFEEANGVFLPYLISDHSLTIMSILRGITKKKKSLRFANYVADKDEILELVNEEWKHKVSGCQMYKVVQRLKLLKKPLNKLNWQNGNLFEKANTLKEKLKVAQSNVDADLFKLAKRQIEVNLVNEYTKVAEDELKLLHQKAKIQWLKEGDKNSAYFYNILKARKNKSRIENICCEDGSRVEGDIVNEALDMIKEVSDIEIKEALFIIDSSKAAGPDGYTSCFFKKAWGVIGADICLVVREFFISDDLMVLCNGDNESLKVVKKSLDDFSDNSGGSAKGKAKVAWKNVCRPKVKWVSTVKLKGKSIWEAEIDNNDSHGWKELIRIRDKIKPYVIFKIRDGKSISVWHDKWCDQGPLDRFIQNRDIYDDRISNEDCLVNGIVEVRWKWADEWSSRFPELCQIDVPLLSHKRDKAVWICKVNKIVNFTTQNAW
nr:hypothetical protein [Tanacetum cinerariifolium]